MVAVGLGDTAMLILFATLGRSSHQSVSEQSPVVGTINTAIPFIIAWLVVGAISGAFTGKAMFPLFRVVWRTLLASVIAGPLGVLLWSVLRAGPELQNFTMSWDFVGVATGVTSGLLLVWRVVWSRIRRLWWPELPF
jgi:hypothetical protein